MRMCYPVQKIQNDKSFKSLTSRCEENRILTLFHEPTPTFFENYETFLSQVASLSVDVN